MLLLKGLVGLILSTVILWIILMVIYNLYLFFLSLHHRRSYNKILLKHLEDLNYYNGLIYDEDLMLVGTYTSDSIQTDYTGTIYRADYPKIFKALESTLKG